MRNAGSVLCLGNGMLGMRDVGDVQLVGNWEGGILGIWYVCYVEFLAYEMLGI